MNIFKDYRPLAALFLLLALPAIASEEAPSTPPRKRPYSALMVTPSPKKRKNRRVSAGQGRLSSDNFSRHCRNGEAFEEWWQTLNDQEKKKVVTLRDSKGKTLAHHLILHDESSAAKIAMSYPDCLLIGNNERAIPADYLFCRTRQDGSIQTTLDGYIVLSATHETCKEVLDSVTNLPSALNALIASMVVCDMGPGFRA